MNGGEFRANENELGSKGKRLQCLEQGTLRDVLNLPQLFMQQFVGPETSIVRPGTYAEDIGFSSYIRLYPPKKISELPYC